MEKLNILALDSATACCSVALALGDQVISKEEIAPRRHDDLILPMLDSVLQTANLTLDDIHVLAFSQGPGSFIGLRLAAGIIQGLAYASGLPVVAVSTLAVLAQGAMHRSSTVITALDAHQNEIYLGTYVKKESVMVARCPDQRLSPVGFTLPSSEPWLLVGEGWRPYRDHLLKNMRGNLIDSEESLYPRAKHMLPLARQAFLQGQTLHADSVLPIYLRDQVTS